MPFGRLMELVAIDPESQITFGELSRHLGEPVERVMDAIDALKVLAGEPSYISLNAAPPAPDPAYLHPDDPAHVPWPDADAARFLDAARAHNPPIAPAGGPGPFPSEAGHGSPHGRAAGTSAEPAAGGPAEVDRG